MSEPKTIPTSNSPEAYIASITDERQRLDAAKLCRLIQSVTGEEPVMWGPSIVGFGKWHYKYDSGREGDTMIVGFSARKQALTLYGLNFYDELPIPENLGKYKLGKGCLYIKSLADVDAEVLAKTIKAAYDHRR